MEQRLISSTYIATGGGGRGGTCAPYDGLYGEAPAARGNFYRLQVYERMGISLLEIYIRVRKPVIWVCERAQRAEQMNLRLHKAEKTFYFCD